MFLKSVTKYLSKTLFMILVIMFTFVSLKLLFDGHFITVSFVNNGQQNVVFYNHLVSTNVVSDYTIQIF